MANILSLQIRKRWSNIFLQLVLDVVIHDWNVMDKIYLLLKGLNDIIASRNDERIIINLETPE